MKMRRGNYSLLLVFLMPLLLGFLAFAIDVGRLRVAAIQVEGAADAASLATLATLRDGGSKADAAAAAQAVLSEIRVQRSLTSASGPEFALTSGFGDWDWTTLGWNDDTSSVNSVTVNLQLNNPLGLLFAPVFNMGGSSGLGWGMFGDGPLTSGGVRDGTKKNVFVGRRASMRPRDVIVVVDSSRAMIDHQFDLQAELSTFVTTMGSFEIGLDRLGTVVYAGASHQQTSLDTLLGNATSAAASMSDIDPCTVGEDAWYHYYRHYDTDMDLELSETVPTTQDFNYNLVEYSTATGMEPKYASHYSFGGNRSAAYRSWLNSEGYTTTFQTADPSWTSYNGGNWNSRTLLDEEQCAAWLWSYMSFMVYDPRRLAATGGALEMNENLACHDGGYWDDRSGRIQTDVMAQEVSCSNPAFAVAGGMAFNVDSDGVAGFDHADLSYQMAGSNTGAGLAAAAAMLDAVQPSRAEPTVILVTSTAAECGAALDPSLVDACEEDLSNELSTAVAALESLGAVTHVLAISTDAVDLTELSGLTTGRGQFFSAETASGLADAFDAVARDIKLQVVQ